MESFAGRGDEVTASELNGSRKMENVYILDGVRTPIGAFRGSLKGHSAADLGGIAIRALLERTQVPPPDVDEVIIGNVISAGAGQAPARQAALKGGLPYTIAAMTVNKVCGSGLKAVMLAAQAIRAGDCQVVVAGGMESMSRAPHVGLGLRDGQKFGDISLADAMILDGLTCAFHTCHMGMHAEHIARKYKVTRADQDAFALLSQQRAGAALEQRIFDNEIVPVEIQVGKERQALSRDECPRPETTLEKLASLRPAFDRDGTVTAGNASTLSDGAAATMVVGESSLKKYQGRGILRVLAYHTSGTAPEDLFIAPALAIREACAKAQLSLNEISLFEINEAFAAQMVACMRELKLSPDRVNVHGGGISLGHPIGASGCRVLVTLQHALQRSKGRYGVASLCLGGGNAVAMVVERI
jgi:acetyl-CoA C-acetyltransferase